MSAKPAGGDFSVKPVDQRRAPPARGKVARHLLFPLIREPILKNQPILFRKG